MIEVIVVVGVVVSGNVGVGYSCVGSYTSRLVVSNGQSSWIFWSCGCCRDGIGHHSIGIGVMSGRNNGVGVEDLIRVGIVKVHIFVDFCRN